MELHKHLISRDGYIVDVLAETIEPVDSRSKTTIKRPLADSRRGASRFGSVSPESDPHRQIRPL
jgi:hypothetical protein